MSEPTTAPSGPVGTRTLGTTAPLTVSAARPRLHGLSELYGNRRRAVGRREVQLATKFGNERREDGSWAAGKGVTPGQLALARVFATVTTSGSLRPPGPRDAVTGDRYGDMSTVEA